MKLDIPPVKKTIKSLRGPTVFSKVFPKTNRKSMLPNRCKTFAWTNSAATRVQTLPFSRLCEADHKIVFRKYRRLLPSPDAGPDASKYE